jgi:hypothetical protein
MKMFRGRGYCWALASALFAALVAPKISGSAPPPYGFRQSDPYEFRIPDEVHDAETKFRRIEYYNSPYTDDEAEDAAQIDTAEGPTEKCSSSVDSKGLRDACRDNERKYGHTAIPPPKTPEEALGIVGSIDDKDEYLVMGYVSMQFPMKTYLYGMAMTIEEVAAQDRRDYIMEEVEGKIGTVFYPTNLNTLSSKNLYFYMPRTSVSIAVKKGTITYTEEVIMEMREKGLDTRRFRVRRAPDGSRIYVLSLRGVVFALPNPSTPVVSQVIVTIDGYGLNGAKAHEIYIEQGVVIVANKAYNKNFEEAIGDILRGYTSGEVMNPFTEFSRRFSFGTAEEEEESVSSSSSETYSSSYSTSSSVSTESALKRSKRGYLWHRERADKYYAMAKDDASSKSQRDQYEKKAKKHEAIAKRVQEEDMNSRLLKDKRGASTKVGAVEATEEQELAAAWGSKTSHAEDKKEEKRVSWVTSSFRNNEIKSLASSHSSAFSFSSSQSLAYSNASHAIMESHQAHEMHYSGASASEFATMEMKHALYAMSAAHAMFTRHGEMYTRSARKASAVSTTRSSKWWLKRSVSRIKRMKKWMAGKNAAVAGQSAAQAAAAMKKAGYKHAGKLIRTAARTRAAAAAAAAAHKRAHAAKMQARQHHSKASSYAARGDKHAARRSRSRASSFRRQAAKYGRLANSLTELAQRLREQRIKECLRQKELKALSLKEDMSTMITPDIIMDIQRLIMQVLTSTQVRILAQAMTPVQITTLTRLLSPLQVQQLLLEMRLMAPSEMQEVLFQLQVRGKYGGEGKVDLSELKGGSSPTMGQASPAEIELMRMQAADQGRAMSEARIGKMLEMKESLREQMKGRIKGYLMQCFGNSTEQMGTMGMQGICNPTFGMTPAGFIPGQSNYFDGFSSAPGIKMTADARLSKSELVALRQLLVCPEVAASLGVDMATLQSMVCGRTTDEDLTVLLMKCLCEKMSPFGGLRPEENMMVRVRYGATQARLYGVYGAALPQFESILMSAYHKLKGSIVNCPKQVVNSYPNVVLGFNNGAQGLSVGGRAYPPCKILSMA